MVRYEQEVIEEFVSVTKPAGYNGPRCTWSRRRRYGTEAGTRESLAPNIIFGVRCHEFAVWVSNDGSDLHSNSFDTHRLILLLELTLRVRILASYETQF